MKRNVRRFLSLLMVFAMACSMIPAAMAAASYSYRGSDGIRWTDKCDDGGDHDWYYEDCDDDVYEYFECYDCYETGRRAHDWDYYEEYDEDYHTMYCNNDDCDYEYDEYYEEHDLDDDGYCIYCEYEGDYYGDYYLEVKQYDDLESNDDYYYEDEEVTLSVEAFLYDEDDDEVDYDDFYFEFYWDGDCYGEEDDDYESSAILDTSEEECYVTCTIYAYDEDYDLVDKETVEWELYCDDYYGDDLVVEAVVYNTSDGYQFDEEDDEGNDSIEDQIADAIYDLDDDYEFESVVFSKVSVSGKGELSAYKNTDYYYYDADYGKNDELLGDVVFYPESDYEGDVEFGFTAWYYDDDNELDYIDGTIVFDVKSGSSTGIGILYTAESDEEVLLDEDSFADFWEEEYPKGTLDYVKFTSVSTGYLYDNYEGGSKKWTDVEGTKCYWDPTSKQVGLDDLTYVPGKSTVSATIKFTAHGTTGSGSRTADLSGTITILYVDDDIEPIEYDATEDVVTLDADDFTAKYKEVMGVKSTGTLQIQFLEAPENGTLYMDYAVKSGKVSGTKLTESNVQSYLFSTSSSATRSIEDVTYVPDGDSDGDTIQFACYSSNQMKFIGTISFDAADPIIISLTCSTVGGTFSTTDFFTTANRINYIKFGTPSSGTLYKNYSYGKGTKVTSSDKFVAYSSTSTGTESISTVAFIPSKSGLVEIPFTATLYTGGTVTGTVKITVVANSFADVPVGSYYYNAVQWAVANNITTGTTTTTFSPNATCTRGQVVTFLWRAKGCPEPTTTKNPFTDVKTTEYYYKAVLWAVENGITTGTSATTFSPDATCTSGQVVTFLWRANGKPVAAYTGTQYYSQAVAWANANGLLSGTGTAFNPENNSPRADIVTYLYRDAT